MSNFLSYFSGVPQGQQLPRSEFDHAVDTERALWLRRRFLWWTALSTLSGIVVSTFQIGSPIAEFTDSGGRFVLLAYYLNLFGNILLTAVAFVWAWRRRPRFTVMLRAALLLFLVSSVWSLLFSRYFMGSVRIDMSNAIEKQIEEDETSTRPSTVPATPPTTSPVIGVDVDADETDADDVISARGEMMSVTINGRPQNVPRKQFVDALTVGILWASVLVGQFFIHFIACLFLPWTLRESLRPALLLIGLTAIIVAIDVAFGLMAWWALPICLLCMVVSFVPGGVWCWWRSSRFNKHFRLRYESTRYHQLQSELTSARQLHEACLPAPRLSGPLRINFSYEPMRQIGGDLLIVHPQSEHADVLTTVIMDVTGHGIAAALAVNRIVGEVERCLAENPDATPLSLLTSLNQYIHLTLARHAVFVSAIAFRVDRRDDSLTYVNAGHPSAFFVRGEQLTRLESTAMLLGVAPTADFFVESVRLDFRPADAVLAYTDGASEATSPEGHMLCIAGVEKIAAATARAYPDPLYWPAAFLGQVVSHREAPPQDDTLVVVITRV
jgi:serine phosphatase RsbU (regulator of sigma subunit)